MKGITRRSFATAIATAFLAFALAGCAGGAATSGAASGSASAASGSTSSAASSVAASSASASASGGSATAMVKDMNGDDVVQVALKPLGGQHPAESVLDLFRGDFLLERADYGSELHVLLRHDAIHHVAYETGDWLVEMGRNPPQKRVELA